MKGFAPFDAAELLTSDEMIAAYLEEAAADPNPAVFHAALASAAKARGMAQIAKDAHLGRESLYKALAPGAKPRMETVQKIVGALGLRMSFQPAEHKAT